MTDHPFGRLQPEYARLLQVMVVRQECRAAVDRAATKIIACRRNFEAVEKAIGVPVVFSGPSFYREADLDFDRSPAQGDLWRMVSKHVPRGLGPYRSWLDAAVAAYRINGLDRVGAGGWTWELVCFYDEAFNGFGYRDEHHMHSPYLWAGTNLQAKGKYDSDGKFDPDHLDEQVGTIPLARRVAELAPDLALGGALAPQIEAPAPSGLAPLPKRAAPGPAVSGTLDLQRQLNKLGYDIAEDGNYGRETRHAVEAFKRAFGLGDDGYADQETVDALAAAADEATSAGAKTGG